MHIKYLSLWLKQKSGKVRLLEAIWRTAYQYKLSYHCAALKSFHIARLHIIFLNACFVPATQKKRAFLNNFIPSPLN